MVRERDPVWQLRPRPRAAFARRNLLIMPQAFILPSTHLTTARRWTHPHHERLATRRRRYRPIPAHRTPPLRPPGRYGRPPPSSSPIPSSRIAAAQQAALPSGRPSSSASQTAQGRRTTLGGGLARPHSAASRLVLCLRVRGRLDERDPLASGAAAVISSLSQSTPAEARPERSKPDARRPRPISRSLHARTHARTPALSPSLSTTPPPSSRALTPSHAIGHTPPSPPPPPPPPSALHFCSSRPPCPAHHPPLTPLPEQKAKCCLPAGQPSSQPTNGSVRFPRKADLNFPPSKKRPPPQQAAAVHAPPFPTPPFISISLPTPPPSKRPSKTSLLPEERESHNHPLPQTTSKQSINISRTNPSCANTASAAQSPPSGLQHSFRPAPTPSQLTSNRPTKSQSIPPVCLSCICFVFVSHGTK
ncbi:hypothetical protein DFH27DRAFT_613966 [Peziza echinospora]|nr:hypothetical protein DFH27DRAFT_613966 [Peziza echinospora]